MTEKELKTIRFEELFRRASARYIRDKVSWAKWQTGDGGRTRTIISVNHDEAIAIEWALDLYLEKTEQLIYEILNRKETEK